MIGRKCLRSTVPETMVAMGQPEVESFCRLLVAVLLVAVLGLNSPSFAQQTYNTDTYLCSDSGVKSCNAFALYRAQENYQDINSTGKLFNVEPKTLERLNRGVGNSKLKIGTPLIIPITCFCSVNQTSYANLTHKIVSGDSFYQLNIVNFEYLSTTQAVIDANPGVNYTNLQIDQIIIFPVRCACPSNSQIASNVTSLVTYPIDTGDSTGEIAASFGVATQSVINANTLVGANSQIIGNTTLLVPINTTSPNYSQVTRPSSAPGSSPSPPTGGASPSGGGSSNSGTIVAIAVGVSAGVLILILAAICMFCTLKRRKAKKHGDDTEAPLDPGKVVSQASQTPSAASVTETKVAPGHPLAVMSELVDSDRPALFTYQELKDATNNFSEGNVLQGSVYRGILKGQVVAIKQMKGNVSQELKILCRVHHSNLIRLVGLCVKEAEHLYLVYEYADNGSVSDCLHTDFLSKNKLSTKSSSFLSWTMRVQIALDAASGLEYIHDYVSPSYVHKDVKSSNILLDRAFRAKIANFAMAKSGGGNADMMTRHIAGTYGYMAPEYLQHGLVTTKADVFSFGVVLLELLSGNEAISEGSGGEERCLYSAIRTILESPDPVTNLKRWMDPVLGSNYPMETAMSMAKLARSCVDSDPLLRPSMKDISFALSNCLNSSLEWETSSVFASTLAETPIEAR